MGSRSLGAKVDTMFKLASCRGMLAVAALVLSVLAQQPRLGRTLASQRSEVGNGRESCVKAYVPRTAQEEELVEVENEWCDAAIHRDAVRLERIFADDISWLEDVGYRNKEQVMHRYMVEIQEHLLELRDVRIRVIGNVGVVSSHIHVKKTTAGKLTDSDHTTVDVFEKRAGRWQLIAES